MRQVILTVAVVALLCAALSSQAEMYRWEDEKGVVTFKDTPPSVSKKRTKVKVYKDSDFDPAPPYQNAPTVRNEKKAAKSAVQPKNERFAGTVEIYVTDWCGYCKQAQSYMNSRGIPYVSYNIEKDSAAKQRHKELGGRGVPLIIIGSNKMSGFSADNLEYYLNNTR